MSPFAVRRPRNALALLAVLACLIVACGGSGSVSLSGAPASASPSASSLAASLSPSPLSPPPSPVPTTPACSNATRLAAWSDARLAWQVIVAPVQLASLAAVRSEVLSDVGGILLFGATAPTDLARQLRDLEATAPGGIAPLAMSDVEGGYVERAANLLGPMPSARQLADTMTAAQIQAFAAQAGSRMRSIGITMDLAPVLDLDAGFGPTQTNPDGTRSFSDNPQVAAADGGAFAAGLSQAHVVPVAKHFPGLHGEGDNTDTGPAVTDSWDALQQGGLVPFSAVIDAGIPALMLSNASVPGLSDRPASISPEVIGALRGQLGFNGLLLTDSLSSGAMVQRGLDVPRAATAALIAGADMVLYSDAAGDPLVVARATAAALEAAVSSGALSRAQLIASVARVLSVKNVDLCAQA